MPIVKCRGCGAEIEISQPIWCPGCGDTVLPYDSRSVSVFNETPTLLLAEDDDGGADISSHPWKGKRLGDD
jgi:ribosomal protein S27E